MCANFRNIAWKNKKNAKLGDGPLKEAVFDVLYEEQAGFCEERGCVGHIFVPRHFVEQSEEWRKSLVLNFVDFS